MYNIAATEVGLPEGAAMAGTGRADQGVNDFRHVHSDGPRPPKGHGTHHYDFRLAALNVARLELPALASVEEAWAAAQPPTVAEAELVGIYER